MATAGSLEALRELNRLRVIDALRQRGTASRSDSRGTPGSRAPPSRRSSATCRQRASSSSSRSARSRGGAGRRRSCGSTPPPGPWSAIHFDHRHRPGRRRRPVVHCARRAHARARRRPRGRRPRSTRPPSSSTSSSTRRASSARRVVGAGVGAVRARRPRRHRRLDGDPARLGRAERRRRARANGSTSRSRSTTTRTSARSPRCRSAPGGACPTSST